MRSLAAAPCRLRGGSWLPPAGSKPADNSRSKDRGEEQEGEDQADADAAVAVGDDDLVGALLDRDGEEEAVGLEDLDGFAVDGGGPVGVPWDPDQDDARRGCLDCHSSRLVAGGVELGGSAFCGRVWTPQFGVLLELDLGPRVEPPRCRGFSGVLR